MDATRWKKYTSTLSHDMTICFVKTSYGAYLHLGEAVAEWFACGLRIRRVLDDAGWNPPPPPSIYKSLSSGLRLPIYCRKDYPSARTLEEL